MAENLFTPDRIRTRSGIYIDPFNPKLEEIDIEDIAHSLSMIPRFGGHTFRHYSVAQHSIWVSTHCSPENALEGLIHDATEAYLIDIPTPIKYRLPDYKSLEEIMMKAVYEKYGLQYPVHQEVKHWDRAALEYEWHNCVLEDKAKCLSPEDAKSLFLNTFYQLYKK